MFDTEWIQKLQPGNEVYISANYGRAPKHAIVSRVTPAQVLVRLDGRDQEWRFNRTTGREVGESRYDGQHLIEATDQVRERVEVETLCSRANYLREHLAIPKDKETLVRLIEALTPFVKAIEGAK